MFWKQSEYRSAAISIAIHGFIILILMIFSFNPEYDTDEYVTVGFGTFGKLSSSGAVSKSKKKELPKKKKVEKKVEVPKAVNVDETNEVSPIVKETKKEETKKVDKNDSDKEKEAKGREETGEGTGKFGFDIDFGGKGMRKIYSYTLPPYPKGVSKEIDVKLRFTIMPDGTVGRIFPLIKADTRLENAAINSLRQWRFEPLPKGQKQAGQTVVITFPFRLR
ncbi:MAG: TonB family protein [Bacteroidota bacterium]